MNLKGADLETKDDIKSNAKSSVQNIPTEALPPVLPTTAGSI
jgi:hypothetical protein